MRYYGITKEEFMGKEFNEPREYSSVTEKFQATIPQKIREYLHIKKGDKIMFEILHDTVQIRKMLSTDFEYLKSISGTLSEWNSEADDEAYNDL
jgi:AbrB family looped-hinge helix DNA binding protein